MQKNTTIYVFFVVMIFIFSCNKRKETPSGGDEAKPGVVSGIVKNYHDDKPAANVTVVDINDPSITATTDVEGKFTINLNLSRAKNLFLIAKGIKYQSSDTVERNISPGGSINDMVIKIIGKPLVICSSISSPIVVPGNCWVSFTIANAGPAGSKLNFTLADTGALGGFLESSTMSPGPLLSGQSTTVNVRIYPRLLAGITQMDLALTVNTPGAGNFVSTPVSVKVRFVENAAIELLGTWAGTWSGNTFGPNNAGEAKPVQSVGGNWSINLQSVNIAEGTASGTLTWTGNDYYWHYDLDNNTGRIINVVAMPFAANRAIGFNSTNTALQYSSSNCTYRITIDIGKNAVNAEQFYGPWFSADIDLTKNQLQSAGTGFVTHPYNPANGSTWTSNGSVTGKKN